MANYKKSDQFATMKPLCTVGMKNYAEMKHCVEINTQTN